MTWLNSQKAHAHWVKRSIGQRNRQMKKRQSCHLSRSTPSSLQSQSARQGCIQIQIQTLRYVPCLWHHLISICALPGRCLQGCRQRYQHRQQIQRRGYEFCKHISIFSAKSQHILLLQGQGDYYQRQAFPQVFQERYIKCKRAMQTTCDSRQRTRKCRGQDGWHSGDP